MEAAAYLLSRLPIAVFEFLRDWFIGGFWFFLGRAFAVLGRAEKFFAVGITIRNFWEPLYQDHSAIGHVMGFVFRAGRIAIGLIVYSLIIGLGFGLYLLWAAVPLYVVWKGFFGP